MADVLVSSLVSTILTNLTDLLVGESAILGGLKSEVENLESTLTTIQAVLCDAEEKQWKSEAVQNWLWKLKDAAYEANDIFDEFDIEAQSRKPQRGFKNRVSSFFSIENPLVFHAKMAHKLKNVKGKLDAIANEKQKFHLREGEREIEGSEDFDRRQTSSLVNELEIRGRDKEKEELANLVLSNSDDFSVYAVWGLGGLGKTTLAQLVYNYNRVESHFDKRIWVCVSDDFDIKRLTKAIIESIEGSCNIQELDPLQRRLQEKLSGKKYLLVLDDVWNEYHDKWEKLINPLRCGTQGSAVIVTTRMEKIALMVATTPVKVQQIKGLSDDDSWLLFERHAFRMRDKEDYTHLETIGKHIVKKCGGVPLALKALGSMMLFKRKESEWLAIKESNILDMPDDGKTILPALKLSYDHLLPHLRQCLSFCSVFPKDYAMKKDQLVGLWIANGFVSYRGPMDLHDMGNEIFNELVLRSLFEDIKEDGDGDITCKLHDLVHDLAQSVMKYECCFTERNKTLEVPKVVRHFAFYSDAYQRLPQNKDLFKIRSLRSLLVSPSVEFLPFLIKQKHLRALRFRMPMEKLPISIDKLKHLRYLDFSGSYIISLTESITSLQKLQTLDLRDCHNLSKLPNGLKHIKDLIYLDITRCYSLACIPPGIGQLTRMRKLSMFIVGKDAGRQIGELGSLNLDGKLSIKGLDNVKDLTDARSADLTSKKNLTSLKLIWQQGNGNNNSTEKIEETLRGLQPHSNVKKLGIEGYEGSRFPNWMMELQLPNLVEISLSCGRCEHLPPLGKLQFLKILRLYNMDAVKHIGSEVYGDDESAFPSLERLLLFNMDNLEEWATVAERNIFPRLGKLYVYGCKKLVDLPVIPSVRTLEIEGESEMLLSSVQNFPSITWLMIRGFGSVRDFPAGLLHNHTVLEHLEIVSMKSLKSLANELDNLSALKVLHLWGCDELESLPEGLLKLNALENICIDECGLGCFPVDGFCGVASLRSLHIQRCNKFTSLSEGVRYLTALEVLNLVQCSELNSLPKSISHLTALQRLSISHCKRLSSLPNEIGCLTSLQHLLIDHCPNLSCLPQGVQNLKRLRELRIRDCAYLERRCQKERGEDWPKVAHMPCIYINDQLLQGTPPSFSFVTR